MKDSASKDHYYHNARTKLIKSSAYSPPLLSMVPLPPFLHKSMGLTVKIGTLASVHFHKIQLFHKLEILQKRLPRVPLSSVSLLSLS